jgi:3-dehydroquinate dehydratase-2
MSNAPLDRRGTVLVLNGPNLDLLGERDPEQYGTTTLGEIEQLCRDTAERLGLEVRCLQSNHEGVLVDAIHDARRDTVGLVGNFAAYTHTSVAILDALAAYPAPVVEVHLSNVHAREEFRRQSFVSRVAAAVIAGAGAHGYVLALEHLAFLLDAPREA